MVLSDQFKMNCAQRNWHTRSRAVILLISFLLFLSETVSAQQVTRPMQDPNVAVPNCGIFRTWDGSLNGIKIINVFSESPYKDKSNLMYGRYDWCTLEPEKDKYDFSRIESLMKKALRNHQRVIIGLANMTIAQSSAHFEYDDKQISSPRYIYDALKKSKYPFVLDELHCKGGYSPNYYSPYLFKRYKALLKAFSKWLNGHVEGTDVMRNHVIYGIEMRYAGYWGEGAINGNIYPSDYKILDSYLNLFVKIFPDIQLIAGALEVGQHCPNDKGSDIKMYSKKNISAMRHSYHLLNAKNQVGRIGLFIDSWYPIKPINNMYDSTTQKVMLDDDDHIIRINKYFKDNVYGKAFLTGEFDYFLNDYNKNLLPYSSLGNQFAYRHTSSITLSNMRTHNAEQYQSRMQEVYDNTKKVMSYTGYRVVLDKIKIFGSSVSFLLTNIGVSRIFHRYYQLHILVKDNFGNDIYVLPSNFDLSSLDYCQGKPLSYYQQSGRRLTFNLPKIKGKVYVIFKDKYNIEYPMTLSNYGRQADGSYYLGEIK